jgi:predicted nucleotidyltransferase
LSDLAAHLERSPSSLQREVARLAEAGILETRQGANRTYYRPNADCPLLPELTGLVAKTVGVADVLRRALAPAAKEIAWAIVYGSLARGEEVAESDIDLLVIGNVKLAELARQLKSAEKQQRDHHRRARDAISFHRVNGQDATGQHGGKYPVAFARNPVFSIEIADYPPMNANSRRWKRSTPSRCRRDLRPSAQPADKKTFRSVSFVPW